MKTNLWIPIMIAVALTASMVVAKSLIVVPDEAAADVTVAAIVEPVAQPPPTVSLIERAPTVPPPATPEAAAENDATQDEAWTVLVVHGHRIEPVVYQNAAVKSRAP